MMSLESPETIRKFWIGGIALLVILLGLEFAVHPHPHFGVDGTKFFHAWYGFGVCVAMVWISKKVIGAVLKRKDTYYDG